jgi:hypothetical protein
MTAWMVLQGEASEEDETKEQNSEGSEAGLTPFAG